MPKSSTSFWVAGVEKGHEEVAVISRLGLLCSPVGLGVRELFVFVDLAHYVRKEDLVDLQGQDSGQVA